MEIQFRADREAHLRSLCEEMGRSVDDFVNEAVLTLMEDYEDGRDAAAALAEFRASGEKAMTLDAVMESYGLELSDLAKSEEAVGSAGHNGSEAHLELSPSTSAKAA